MRHTTTYIILVNKTCTLKKAPYRPMTTLCIQAIDPIESTLSPQIVYVYRIHTLKKAPYDHRTNIGRREVCPIESTQSPHN